MGSVKPENCIVQVNSTFRSLVKRELLLTSTTNTISFLGFDKISFAKVLNLKTLGTKLGISNKNLYPSPLLG